MPDDKETTWPLNSTRIYNCSVYVWSLQHQGLLLDLIQQKDLHCPLIHQVHYTWSTSWMLTGLQHSLHDTSVIEGVLIYSPPPHVRLKVCTMEPSNLTTEFFKRPIYWNIKWLQLTLVKPPCMDDSDICILSKIQLLFDWLHQMGHEHVIDKEEQLRHAFFLMRPQGWHSHTF